MIFFLSFKIYDVFVGIIKEKSSGLVPVGSSTVKLVEWFLTRDVEFYGIWLQSILCCSAFSNKG